MLFVHDMPWKIMFNGLYIAIFLDFFDGLRGHNHYLLGTFPYLEFLHSSRFGVSTFVQHNPFSRIRYINQDDPRGFRMLFVKRSHDYKPSFITMQNWNWNKNYLINCSSWYSCLKIWNISFWKTLLNL
jgi:hypothetical protein